VTRVGSAATGGRGGAPRDDYECIATGTGDAPPAAGAGAEVCGEAGADPGTTLIYWGPSQDFVAEYFASGDLDDVSVGPTYTGKVTFQSRSAGAYGSGHVYKLGMGSITKDGAPFAIGWGANPAAGINEIYDGMMATFAPSYPAIADCTAINTCFVDDQSQDDGGAQESYFGIRPLVFYVGMVGQSNPNTIYTFFVGGTVLPADAGVPGLSGDGGLSLPNANCVQMGPSALGYSCADPPAAGFCSKAPGDVPVECQDWPVGYTVTCCPADGG